MSEAPPLWLCPPPGPHRREALRDQLAAWTSSTALAALVEMFDASVPRTDSLSERLTWLDEFSARWDFRRMARERAQAKASTSQDAGGAARWELLDSGLDPSQERRVLELASALGLVDNHQPERSRVDFLLILGGARLSNLLRPRYASELIAADLVKPAHIVILGGSRPVMDGERDATDSYAPGAATEFDLLTTAAAAEFGFDPEAREEQAHRDPQNANASWRVWDVPATETAAGAAVIAVEAPSPEPDARRANTADSYAFFADRFRLRPGAACLLVTSQIYVPYQHLEGVRSLALPFELELETAGFPADWEAELQGMQGPVNYLQETRSTIQAARRLGDALNG